jgi:hypothetical protein
MKKYKPSIYNSQVNPDSKNHEDMVAHAVLSGSFDMRSILSADARIHGATKVDLSRWWGRGIDEWVAVSMAAMLNMLLSGRYQTSTIKNSCSMLDGKFFKFIVDSSDAPIVSKPSDLRPIHLTRYIEWLSYHRKRSNQSLEGARHAYTEVKRVLLELISMKEIAISSHVLFPKIRIPNGNGQGKVTGLTDSETLRLAAALKADFTDAYHKRLVLNDSEIATNRFLIVAMRGGFNLTDLIELPRDCLKPGLIPGVMRLTRKKHRAQKSIERGVASSSDDIELGVVSLNIVAIINRTIKDTEHLTKEVPIHLANRLWLFKPNPLKRGGSPARALAYSTIYQNTKRMVERRNIVGDDGKLLVVNTSRLRKSTCNKLFRISNGDVMAVADALGNTPNVVGTNYLSMNSEIKALAANYLNNDYVNSIRGKISNKDSVKIYSTRDANDTALEETVIAHCEDPLSGVFAPKDGSSRCHDFESCLACPSFAVVGETNEIWKLFSFQQYLKSKDSLVMHSNELKNEDSDGIRSAMINFIDQFTESNFSKDHVQNAA